MKGFIITQVQNFLTRFPRLHRFLRYGNPRQYWRKRGGEKYYAEQEAVEERHARSAYIAQKLKRLEYQRVLEIGCGYGKQLKNLKKSPLCLTVGIDWSLEQLMKAKEVCKDSGPALIEADAAKLPFKDNAFDLVLTSAVIMHNPEPQAKLILSEILRVGTRYVAHNEDTNITFTRHGYDLGDTYRKAGIKVLESAPIPLSPPIAHTQFTIADINSAGAAKQSLCDISMQYHVARTAKAL